MIPCQALDEAYRALGPGAVLEFGVRSGEGLLRLCQHAVKAGYDCRFYGFDSWEGLPEEGDSWVPERHAKGKFCTPKEEASCRLEGLWRVQLVDGWFCDSLTEALKKRVGDVILVVVDCDLYISTLQALTWCRSLLRPGVVIYFDDWIEEEHPEPWGEEKAWIEFSSDLRWHFVYRDKRKHVVQIEA